MTSTPTQAPLRTIHHVGYMVDDLDIAARNWHELTGAGPFLVMPHLAFDEVTVDGQPVVFDHTPAFARHGSIYIELQVVHQVEPESMMDRIRPRTPGGIHHIAYVLDDVRAGSATLSAHDMPCVIEARAGDLHALIHDAVPLLGTAAELHQQSTFLTEFFGYIDTVTESWDGRDLLVTMPS